MSEHRERSAWIIGAAFAVIAASASAGGDTPTWADALEASPNRATPAEQAQLEARAASGESALEAPPGVYTPNAAEPSATEATRRSTDTATPAGSVEREKSASGAPSRDSSQ
jgi:hypothetical protein